MTTVYTLREYDDQLLLQKICWRPSAMDPVKKGKRKEVELALKLACVDIWPGGQLKWCSAIPRLELSDGIANAALQRSQELSADPAR
jgi:hypothetical protein